jgi:hypothetical protein
VAAFRPDDEHKAARWRFELHRRIRSPYVCVRCGEERDVCVCDYQRRENYAGNGHAIDDPAA